MTCYSLVNLSNLSLCIQKRQKFNQTSTQSPPTTHTHTQITSHNVEPGYDTIVGPYRGANTNVDRTLEKEQPYK